MADRLAANEPRLCMMWKRRPGKSDCVPDMCPAFRTCVAAIQLQPKARLCAVFAQAFGGMCNAALCWFAFQS